MIKIEKKSFLKDTPDYEEYTENVANLTTEEMEELGIKAGCCKTKGKNGCGCSSGKGCCNKK